MKRETEMIEQGITKKCTLINLITKLDVIAIDLQGNPLLQLNNQNTPAFLQNFNNEFSTIKDVLTNNTFNNFYYYINSFGLEYIATGIWDNKTINGFILVGPFLSSIPSIDFISNVISKNKLPVSERRNLLEFYKSLSILSSIDSNSIGELLVNLCNKEYVSSQLISSDQIKSSLTKEEIKNTIEESKNIIEIRYSHEKKLMNAITKGAQDEVKHLFHENSTIFNFSDRIPESPIRSFKNLLLVLNTLCRIAAEKGGVHPVYIHSISEKFAILVERAHNLPYLKKLSTVMVNEYCDTVKRYSTHKYSPVVKKAINYIDLNLEHSLTLQEIASTLHVNPSHLSRKFKEDTKTNVIDYINQKRVEEAKYYLQRGDISITEIAFMVGFNDVNYFSRVFKKFTSFTPSQYNKKINLEC